MTMMSKQSSFKGSQVSPATKRSHACIISCALVVCDCECKLRYLYYSLRAFNRYRSSIRPVLSGVEHIFASRCYTVEHYIHIAEPRVEKCDTWSQVLKHFNILFAARRHLNRESQFCRVWYHFSSVLHASNRVRAHRVNRPSNRPQIVGMRTRSPTIISNDLFVAYQIFMREGTKMALPPHRVLRW